MPNRQVFSLKNFNSKKIKGFLMVAVITLVGGFAFFQYWSRTTQTQNQLRQQLSDANVLSAEQLRSLRSLEVELASVSAQYQTLFNEDQVATNRQLRQEIQDIQRTFRSTLSSYETLIDLTQAGVNTKPQLTQFATILNYLSNRNWASASAVLTQLQGGLAKLQAEGQVQAVQAVSAQTPPDAGYRRQRVTTTNGDFIVDIYSASLGSVRVIVDTASDGSCANDCPVMSVGAYAARNGALAAINGSYFCPASYPSCADKKNSFDTLLMNKNKVYFNSDNNVYSNVPVAVFTGGSARFLGRSSDWGRDTGVDAVIANQPLLVQNGNLLFAGDDDAKRGAKSNRSFLAESDGKVFIGVVRNSNVAEAARVLSTMGIKNALNLDSGGSTAFWAGGYKLGPGRDVPNAVVIVGR